ncbi:hypothetical protein [Symmachiella dynata]|uniref:hypothetical protein n=1 Tax=Symmachiella dynata TaxID=2527995 RepID=UPI0030EB9612
MASSKNTGLTLTLVFFVITTLISSVWAIMMTQENQERLATQEEDKKTAVEANQLAKSTLDDINQLKALLGHDHPEVGDANEELKDETVIGAVLNDLKTYGGDLQEGTVLATLQNLHAALSSANQQLAQKQKMYDELQTRFAMLDQTNKDQLAKLDEARTAAEQSLAENTETHQDILAKKDDTIREKQESVNSAEGRAEEAEQKLADVSTDLSERIKRQSALNRRLSGELREIKKEEVERPDGEIVKASRDKRMVWINLGSSDRLPKRMTFSVYKKGHSGIARTNADIKGAIEITKILGPHLAEARVVDADFRLPITDRDPIYTPLWSPGRTEKMAIVGFVDLDGDGRSDRKKLRELITSSGASVVTEILDDGTTIPEDADFSELISTDVKFVILGDMPRPEDSSVPKERQQILDVLREFNSMQEAALDNGVRLVSLSDFLNFIGYKAEQRLYRPGDKRKYTLKSGSRSAAVDETIIRLGDGSSGQTAGKYSRHPLLKTRSSSDQTSKRYKAGSKDSK